MRMLGIGKGMLCVKNTQQPYYVMEGNDHEPIFDRFKLPDTELFLTKIVRIKILPKGHLFSRNVADWLFYVNDVPNVNAWFEEEKDLWHTRCVNTLVDKIIPQWERDGITGFLDISGTEITELPDNLKIKSWKKVLSDGYLQHKPGFLNLANTKIAKLPKGLVVEGDLTLTGSLITELPKDLKVHGDIHAGDIL